MDAIASEDLLGRRHARAIGQAMEAAEGLQCSGHGLAAVGLAGDVGPDEARLGAKLGGLGRAGLGVDVGQHHLATLLHQHLRGGGAEAGAAAGNQEHSIFDTHVVFSC